MCLAMESRRPNTSSGLGMEWAFPTRISMFRSDGGCVCCFSDDGCGGSVVVVVGFIGVVVDGVEMGVSGLFGLASCWRMA